MSEGGKSDKFDSYLSHAQEPATGVEDSRQRKVSGRLKRVEDAAQHMQICLATGVNKSEAAPCPRFPCLPVCLPVALAVC